MIARFTLTEHDGISRTEFPITGGIPLPQGALPDPNAAVLRDDRNRRLKLQSQPLALWPDGSARWLLLDFQTDLKPLQTRTYELSHEPPSPMSADHSVYPAVVAGEPLPRRKNGATAVKNSYIRVVTADNTTWDDYQPEPSEVIREGPLRTTIKTAGAVFGPQRRRSLRWEARTSFYHGKPWSGTRLTCIADEGPEPIELQDLALIVNIENSRPAEFCLAGANAPWAGEMTPIVNRQGGVIQQTDANDSSVTGIDGEIIRPQTLKNRGYIGCNTANGPGIGLALDEFWQSFPKAMQITDNAMEVHFWPQSTPVTLTLPAGAARTYSLTLVDYDRAETLTATVTGLTTPILPRLSLPELNETRVMPALLQRARQPVPLTEALTEMMFTGWSTFTTRANCGVWGLGELNFGDFRADEYAARQIAETYGQGTIWGNQEAQVPYGMLIQYLRTGEVCYLLQGLACSRHQADVDTIHSAADPGLIGGQHVHSANHTTGVVTTSHMWTSGIGLAYLLTGDDRLKAVLHETGEYLLRHSENRDLDQIQNRDGGWHLIALCACAEIFPDPRYRQQARHLSQGLRHWIDNGATCLVPPAMQVFAPVHLFIALTGIRDYWRLTGDENARETLLRGGAMALEKGLNELGYFVMEDAQSYRYPSRWQLCHCLPVMETLYRITGDRKWIDIGVRQAELMMKLLENDTRWGLEDNWAQGGIFFAYAFSFFHTATELERLQDIQ